MTASPPFLGRGWSFPPRFTGGGAEVEMVAGADDIRESLEILFATDIGERVMREDYGSSLAAYVFAPVDRTLLTQLEATITDAILYHEPRIRLDSVEVTENPALVGHLLISLVYTIRGTNSRFNMVYPFYQKEATAGPTVAHRR